MYIWISELYSLSRNVGVYTRERHDCLLFVLPIYVCLGYCAPGANCTCNYRESLFISTLFFYVCLAFFALSTCKMPFPEFLYFHRKSVINIFHYKYVYIFAVKDMTIIDKKAVLKKNYYNANESNYNSYFVAKI